MRLEIEVTEKENSIIEQICKELDISKERYLRICCVPPIEDKKVETFSKRVAEINSLFDRYCFMLKELEAECSHRFGRNRFKLYRLPIPKVGFITGLVGRNGIGKTTALKILSGELKPNLGLYDEEPSWDQIIQFHKGSTLQNYY